MTQVHIAYAFHRGSAGLTMTEKGRLLDLVGKLQYDPSLPGLSMERVERAPDPNVWSVRVSQDLRAIVWRQGSMALLLYAGHHDDAYQWAERHRVGLDQLTGALQLIMLPTVTEAAGAPADVAPVLVGIAAGEATPFAAYGDETLLAHGAPPEWLERIRDARPACQQTRSSMTRRVAPYRGHRTRDCRSARRG
jgi:hypothetical protein